MLARVVAQWATVVQNSRKMRSSHCRFDLSIRLPLLCPHPHTFHVAMFASHDCSKRTRIGTNLQNPHRESTCKRDARLRCDACPCSDSRSCAAGFARECTARPFSKRTCVSSILSNVAELLASQRSGMLPCTSGLPAGLRQKACDSRLANVLVPGTSVLAEVFRF